MNALMIKDNEIWLATKEAAELEGITERAIQKQIMNGKMAAREMQHNRGGGKGGAVYQIPLSSLNDRARKKYWRKQKLKEESLAPSVQKPVKQLDEFSSDERVIIQQWLNAINDWQMYRACHPGQKTAVDTDFITENQQKYKDISLSVDNLYRRWKAVRENDYDALVDKRGKWAKGKTSIPQVVWEIFKYLYLDENKLTIKKCFELAMIYVEKEMPELEKDIPSYYAFGRAEKTIPFAVKMLFREGNKAFEDEAMPYISRILDELNVNDIWVADGHTLDVISIIDGTEKVHRLTVVSFMDVKSSVVVGWHITDSSSSQSVLMALRKGIIEYGIPKVIYVDNGREFLCFDIGGRGHRKTRKDDGEHIPPGVFERLGITMLNALPRNGRAKLIERSHKQYKEDFSRLITGFCGGTIFEKPENLKKTLKSKKHMVYDSDLIKKFDTYVRGWYNEQESKGLGTKGRKRIEVYNDELPYIHLRKASEEELNLMLMRSGRMQTVGEKGVYLDIGGQKLHYWTNDFLLSHQKQKVYVRYDPENLDTVRVYDEHDVLQGILPLDRETNIPYGSSAELVKVGMRKIRSFKKTTKEYMDNSVIESLPPINRLDLMIWKAEQNIEARAKEKKPQAKVTKLVRANEPVRIEPEETSKVKVDINKMCRISEIRKENAM